KRRRHVFVQLEMMAARPFGVHLARAGVERCVRASSAAHLLDDVARVRDEQLVVVRRSFRIVEHRRGARDGGLEFLRIEVDIVPLRKRLVPFAAEHRPWIDQREIDIEQNGARPRRRFTNVHAEYGPAITTLARSTDRYFFATAFACSSVTARSRSGTR